MAINMGEFHLKNDRKKKKLSKHRTRLSSRKSKKKEDNFYFAVSFRHSLGSIFSLRKKNRNFNVPGTFVYFF